MTLHHVPTDIDEIVSNLGEAAKAFSGKTVMMTGGLGFLGRYFGAVFDRLNRDLDRPCKVILLDNLITNQKFDVAKAVANGQEYHRHDVIKPFEYNGTVDYVIHMAGIASPFYYREYPLETLEVSITGTKNMLDLARARRAKFLFFSSSEIYGDPDAAHVPTNESYRGNVSCLGPRACYDESKRVGETLCRIYQQRYGVDTTIVRPFNVYGPGMQETDYRVLPNFASQIVAGRPLTVYGNGKQTRTYCYIADALTGFLLALLRGVPGEPYNIGNPNPEISVLQLVEYLARSVGDPIDHVVLDHPDTYPADEPQRRCPDIRKARAQLGYEPSIDLEDGLNRFLSWSKVNYQGLL